MATNTSVSSSRIADSILIVGFLGLLGLPSLGLIRSGEESISRAENRTLAASPPLAMLRQHPKEFLKEFGTYFNDHFLLRSELVRLNSRVNYSILGESPSSRVILGAPPWLFYAGEETVSCDIGNEITEYRALYPYTEAQLGKIRRLLEARQRWANDLGARFLFVIAPNKSTIYHEFMPRAMNRLSGRSRVDQVVEMLRSSTTIAVLDLRTALDSAKTTERVYYLTDTHWNSQGAYAGYSATMSVLHEWFPELAAIPRGEFQAHEAPYSGDLAAMLGLKESLTEPTSDLRHPDSRFRFVAPSLAAGIYPKVPMRHTATEVSDPRLPSVLIFHDSFIQNLQPFLSQHFRTALYIWSYGVDRRVVEHHKPQLVVLECLERYFDLMLDSQDDLTEPGDRSEAPQMSR